jgi:hypothetical protein
MLPQRSQPTVPVVGIAQPLVVHVLATQLTFLVCCACAARVLADNRETYTVATKFGNVIDMKTGDVTVVASLGHLS